MFPNRKAAPQLALARVFRLLSSVVLVLLPLGVMSFAVEISVVSNTTDESVPVAYALVNLNGKIQYTDSDGIARMDLKTGEQVSLRVTHPNFLKYTGTITGDGNPKAVHQVVLKPDTLFQWQGIILDRYSKTPAIGATLTLDAADDLASISNHYRATSDWDGNYRILGVAPGEYRLKIEKPGFKTIEQILQLSENAPPATWELDATVDRIGNIRLRVIDSTSGLPVSSAAVRLEEGYEVELVETAVTNAAGIAEFKGIHIGIHNRSNGEKQQITVSKLLANITAEGYHACVFAVEVDGDYTFKLDPKQLIPEQEPNNSFTEAQTIPASVDIEHKVDLVGDQDFFRFELLNHAHVSIKGQGPFERYYSLYDSDGKPLWNQGVHANNEASYTNGLARGIYFIKAEEWGNNSASAEPCTLELRSNGTADGLEPNDTAETARVVQPGVAIHGVIFPTGDLDFYRFHLDQPGVIRYRLENPSIEMYASLYRVDGDTLTNIAAQGVHATQLLELWGQVQQPGDYLLKVEEWGNNGYSRQPYRSTLDFLPDDGIEDPAITEATLPQARKWKLNTRLSSSILPIADQDVYRLDLPTPGMLQIEAYAPWEFYSMARQSDTSVIFAVGTHGNNKTLQFIPIDQPKSVYFTIEEWGNNATSADAYTISNFWYPSENCEQAGRNDAPEQATGILPDTQFQGNLFPVGDGDWYQFLVPFPGQLSIRGFSPIEAYIQVKDARMQSLFSSGFHAGAVNIDLSLLPGLHFFKIEEWGNNGWNLSPYRFEFDFRRAEPNESVPVAQDPERQLQFNQAQSYKIDLIGDQDQFIYESPGGENLVLYIQCPIENYVTITNDQTGDPVKVLGIHKGSHQIALSSEQPIRYRIRLEEWGNNGRSDDDGYLMIAPPGSMIPAATIVIDPGNAETKTAYFSRKVLETAAPVQKVEVDVDGDGMMDLTIPETEEVSHRFAKTGAHRVAVRMTGIGGVTTLSQMWVDIPHEKLEQGLAVSVAQPGEGQTVLTPFEIEAEVVNFSQSRIEQVTFSIDGKLSHADYSSPYAWSPPWAELEGKDHTLKVTARDNRGKVTTVERSFVLSPFFDLQPIGGTSLSGENARISWVGNQFGKAEVKIRKAGTDETAWTAHTGESGRYRSILLKDLTPGTRYEYQVSDGLSTSPVQSFNLVKGLAFGKPSYGANIKRDYDQRLGISVRNNSDDPLTVQLECGQPENSNLLVGFVGDGSADKPFQLKPGEEREFTLGMSAQDVVKENHEFPINIVSTEGRTDQAIVKVNVRLPQIKLEWQEIGNTPLGLGKRYKLYNRGDTVTDLAVTASDPAKVIVTPSIFHGMLPAGQSIEMVATPRLFNGFKSATCELLARALEKEFAQSFAVAVPEGKELHEVLLIPGINTPDSPGYFFQELNMEAAESLDPTKLDWSSAVPEEDITGDGVLDRWVMYKDNTEWMGDDTDGNGTIDFVHADIGQDGIYEYSALLEADGTWSRTNLVEGWLEMGFSLPWSASAYHPHNVDILLNDTVIGQLRDTIPNGNYTFYMPPHLIRFNERGEPDNNQIGIHSEHLRGGHYVVNSDFRFNIRMTATPVWSVGTDQADALRAARQTEGLVTDVPDFSVSSSDLVFEAPEAPKAGDPCFIQSTLRNLGAVSPKSVDVALIDDRQGRESMEIQRIRITDLSADAENPIEFSWRATPGQHKLRIVADPDEAAGDLNRLNNEAIVMVTIPGDDGQPTLSITSIRAPDDAKPQVIEAAVRCEDDSGIQALEVCVDSSIWQALPTPRIGETSTARFLLQPGQHLLKFRVTDAGGNQVEAQKPVSVTIAQPHIQLLYPKSDVEVEARSTHVMISCPPGTVLAAARIEGGPWYRGKITATAARAYVPLNYGQQTLEVMIVDRNGIAAFAQRKVTCIRQPHEGETDTIPPAEDGRVRIPTLGEVDYFIGLNHLL